MLHSVHWNDCHGDVGPPRKRQGLATVCHEFKALRWGDWIAILGAYLPHTARSWAQRGAEAMMTQTSNRLFDELARLMNDAVGVASGARREFDTLVRTQADRVLRELDLVQREEFEAVKEMASLAREENEVLRSRLAGLEARLARAEAPPVTPAAAGAAAQSAAPTAPESTPTDEPRAAPSVAAGNQQTS